MVTIRGNAGRQSLWVGLGRFLGSRGPRRGPLPSDRLTADTRRVQLFGCDAECNTALRAAHLGLAGCPARLGALIATEIITVANDVVLTEIRPGLDFDNPQRDLSGISKPVHFTHGDEG